MRNTVKQMKNQGSPLSAFGTWRFQASGIDFINFLRFTARKKVIDK
jgi:hypothetical protein